MTFVTDSIVDNKPIIKSTLTQRIAEKCKDTHPKDIETAIKHILDCMNSTLQAGGRIEIRDFGAFSLRYRPPGNAHNPKTGKKVTTYGKYVLYFRPGKEFKERINSTECLEEEAEEVCV